MKLKKLLLPVLTLSLTFGLIGCKNKENSTSSSITNSTSNNTTPFNPFSGTYDNMGGGSNGVTPTKTSVSENAQTVDEVVNKLEKSDITEYDLANASLITSGGSIASSGLYLLTGEINLTEAISFTKKATNVHLIIKDATINITDDKAISSKLDLEITILGTNTITNSLGTNNSSENLIKCGGNLTINGSVQLHFLQQNQE